MKPKLSALSTLLLLPALASAADKHPNVIVIMADDLGWGDVSAYGNRSLLTPHIDSLARGGVCFTDGHAASATSTPSRYALMTGMYPWKNKDAKILPGDAPLLINPQQFTIAKMFRNAGYATAAIGKWHLGLGRGKIDWNRKITPGAYDLGFDYSYLIAATVDRVPTVYVENGCVDGLDPSEPISVDYNHPFPGEPTAINHPEMMRMRWSDGHQGSIINGIPRIGYMKGGKSAIWNDTTMARHLLQKVQSYIDTASAARPFFLYYGLHEPHVPRVPDTPFAGTTNLGPRGDVVKEADWCVGQVVEMLRKKGLLENTIIIFTSDNGPVLDDGYQDGSRGTRQLHDPNGGLRGGKYSLFEAGTRVPFFVYWEGTIRPVVSHAFVTQQDLLASLAALVEQPVPAGLDSQNLLNAFLGKSDKGRKGFVVEAEGRLAYRSGNYALLPPYKGPKTNNTGNELGIVDHWSLYDLAADPAQQTDISAKKPGLMRKLQKQFTKEGKGLTPTPSKGEGALRQ